MVFFYYSRADMTVDKFQIKSLFTPSVHIHFISMCVMAIIIVSMFVIVGNNKNNQLKYVLAYLKVNSQLCFIIPRIGSVRTQTGN